MRPPALPDPRPTSPTPPSLEQLPPPPPPSSRPTSSIQPTPALPLLPQPLPPCTSRAARATPPPFSRPAPLAWKGQGAAPRLTNCRPLLRLGLSGTVRYGTVMTVQCFGSGYAFYGSVSRFFCYTDLDPDFLQYGSGSRQQNVDTCLVVVPSYLFY